MADVGLLGFPNVGKSTLIRAVSRARPRVDDFPFTTLRPHLGIVSLGGGPDPTQFAMADIPGLIPGASEGAGLGIRFLKHLERTRVLLHLVTLDPAEDREPWDDYVALREELARFDANLAGRPEIVALSKCDLPDVREAYPDLKERFAQEGIDLCSFSAATGEGTREVVAQLAELVSRARMEPEEDAPASSETSGRAPAES